MFCFMQTVLVKSSYCSTRRAQAETEQTKRLAEMDVSFQLAREKVEKEDLVFLLLPEEKRYFLNLRLSLFLADGAGVCPY